MHQTPIKTSSPANLASQNASVGVSSKFYSQNNFKAASRNGLARTSDMPSTLPLHRGWAASKYLGLLGLDHCHNLIRILERCNHFQTIVSSIGNMTPTFSRCGMGDFWLLGEL